VPRLTAGNASTSRQLALRDDRQLLAAQTTSPRPTRGSVSRKGIGALNAPNRLGQTKCLVRFWREFKTFFPLIFSTMSRLPFPTMSRLVFSTMSRLVFSTMLRLVFSTMSRQTMESRPVLLNTKIPIILQTRELGGNCWATARLHTLKP
jgi:hypothetical protein